MNILKRLFCKHDYKFMRNIEWKRSLWMCPKCGSFQYRNEIKCDGCNNFKGCVTCKDGSEWAHYEEPVSEDLEEAAEEYANSIAQHENNKLYSIDDFKAGAEWQKQQVMKDAVEVEYWDGSFFRNDLREMFKDGDKVKIIIVNEE